MRSSVKFKDFIIIFFLTALFFPAFNASLFFTGITPLLSLIKGCPIVFYDWRMLILCFGFVSFSLLNIHAIILTLIKLNFIKITNIINFITEKTMDLCLIFLFTAIVIAPFIAPFVTQYVNAHYHPCGDNTGIFSGETYVKNGMDCNLQVW